MSGRANGPRLAFLDTSGWFPALSPREHRHADACALYREWLSAGTALVTTNLVVAELQVLLMRARGASFALEVIDFLYRDSAHEVVFVDRELERSAVDRWLRRFDDQRLSLADAVSFEVMHERRIRDVLTLDAHFRVAGFTSRLDASQS